MKYLERIAGSVLTLAGVALISSCGGGGGSGAAAPPAGWVQGVFQPASSFEGLCAAPRTGTDPITNVAYPDHQGTALEERNWLRSWTHDLYLWFDEVTDQDPASFSTDAAYFAVLKTTATTASGALKDKFHFTYDTAVWESLSQTGEQAGYGATFVLVSRTVPRKAVVGYTEPGSPAVAAAANLTRGTQVLTVDGVDVVNGDGQTDVNTLNAGLFPATAGETHSFSILDPGATTARTVSLTSVNVTETPVQNVKTIANSATDIVGYLTFNDHIATAESALVNAITQLKSQGITDLVLDIRYNGGGYLDIASELAYMIAGPGPTNGQTFELQQFNSQHPTVNPITNGAIAPVPFHSTGQGFSVTSGTALPTLNLQRVFVLTSASTCSASEAIINSLRGVNVEVIEVGTTTCGKPYGFYPQDNCGTTYFSIQFRDVNAIGFGDYTDGFTPMNTTATEGALVPGCSVDDDFDHALGDTSEGQLAAALSYRSTGACPTPPAATGGSQPLGIKNRSQVMKSQWLQNRIFRPAAH